MYLYYIYISTKYGNVSFLSQNWMFFHLVFSGPKDYIMCAANFDLDFSIMMCFYHQFQGRSWMFL